MKIAFTILVVVFHLFAFGQTSKGKQSIYDLPIPDNIQSCFKLLDRTMNKETIYIVKTLQEDSIYLNSNFRSGTDFFHAWKLYDGSKLTKYFNQMGLRGPDEIYETILVSYHRYLNGNNINLKEQIERHQAKQKVDNEIYLAKLNKDSLNGVYIPRDLKDCFQQLDKILSPKDKDQIKFLKNRNETIQFHHSLGMWIRNNWGLWSGSRLQVYLLEKKLDHPDSMSSTILKFYYDWLNKNNEAWIKWTK